MSHAKYPEMRDSDVRWIGHIPNELGVVKIKSVAIIKTGSTPTGNDGINLDSLGYSWFTPSDSKPSLILNNAKKYIASDSIKKYKISLYEPKTILFVGIGKIGLVGITNTLSYSNQQITAIQPNKVNPKFMLYSMTIASRALGRIAPSTMLPIVNNGLLANTRIALPDSVTQQKIADFLDTETAKIDNLITKQEQLLKLLEEKRRATITSAVHPNTNTIEERFRDICTLNPVTQASFKDDDIVSFYPMESIGDDSTIDHNQTRPHSAVKAGYTVFQNDDVIVAKVTPCFENYKGAHMTDIASSVGFGTTELFVLRANEKVTPKYLYWLTQAQDFNNHLAGGMRGTGGLKRVVPEELKNYKVKIPKLEVQKKIIIDLTENLNKFETLKRKVTKQIDLLKERRTSLISHAVTGKIRI